MSRKEPSQTENRNGVSMETIAPYQRLNPYFGDLHNHCGISYGHGTMEEALQNARERLDFCSVTGHAFWPDMPQPRPEIQNAIEYHEKGFSRLRRQWPYVRKLTQSSNVDGEFVTFLSFEMHSCADGDYTILYRDGQGEILYSHGLSELQSKLKALHKQGVHAIAIPHHIAYPRGRRGINWNAFNSDFSPVVEIISMHGCSETDESARPFLHTMGPSDHESTMQYGLSLGHVFGVIGSTDHHSAHPGSYGHGLCGIWAEKNTRASLWDALLARRTFALTGDRIQLSFALNSHPMGARVAPARTRLLEIGVLGGAPIDYVDLLRNNHLIRRFSELDVPRDLQRDTIRTKIFLEVGWGQRRKRVDWDVTLGLSAGRILSVEPRFRGAEVVAPTDNEPDSSHSNYTAHWESMDERQVRFHAMTLGNPNNFTCATQGVCLDVDVPADADIRMRLNGKPVTVPLSRLLEGAVADHLGGITSPAYRLHRAPQAWEFDWRLTHRDDEPETERDVYYVRVRQKNDQWAWSSPIFIV